MARKKKQQEPELTNCEQLLVKDAEVGKEYLNSKGWLVKVIKKTITGGAVVSMAAPGKKVFSTQKLLEKDYKLQLNI